MVGGLISVDLGLVLGDEARPLAKGADGADAGEELGEGGEDGRLGRSVEALELA